MSKSLTNQGFTPIENRLLKDTSLSCKARMLAIIISSYCHEGNECYPSQQTLANDMGMSVRSIQRYLTELKEAGIVRVIRRGHTSNIYKFLISVRRFIDKTVTKVKTSMNKAKQSYTKSKNKFKDYSQRSYNMDILEDMLLGNTEFNPKELYKEKESLNSATV
ncbi:MAG: helix-turn-helix domain-containing protein [Clostridia bacterium]